MIEAGLVTLIQSGLSAQGIAVPGGYAVQLPENLISATQPQAWTYRSITSVPLHVLEGQDPLTHWEVQLDCCGLTMAHAITLARGIDNVLRGSWSGTLDDPDATVVQAILRLPSFVDGFNDANRTFVRSLEYQVIYVQI